MWKTKILTAMLISVVLAANLTSLILFAEAEEPTKAVKKPQVTITNASDAAFSGYNITTETADEGRVTFLFVWQRRITWNFSGFSGEIIFDTPPILQMAKYEKNGSLEYSVTYVPLFLLQYNDTDENGVFDIKIMNSLAVTTEVDDDLIDWWEQQDKPLKAYSLAPIFYFRRQYAWGWTVSSLTSENVTVDGTQVPTYSWNISATVPSLPWLRECRFAWNQELPETTTVNVTFGYKIRLLPDNPEVKYDLKFNGITWANDSNATRLALMSAVLYHSKTPPVVCVGVRRFFNFSETEAVSVAVRRFLIAENVTDNIKAFVSFNPNATVDGVSVTDVVKTAIHPLFVIPITEIVVVPAGVYIAGVCPGIILGRCIWRHYLAFSHQLSLPHFNQSIQQDPEISISATLPTESLQSTTGSLLTIRGLILVAVSVSVIGAAAYVFVKRRTVAHM